ncbi:unnamed protein product [Linum trigynum]|uniref:Uncharacterized protein n=1 Tax=Linum trigynum TaxID=586398 RepID=A0AAV2CU49_9ROSI
MATTTTLLFPEAFLLLITIGISLSSANHTSQKEIDDDDSASILRRRGGSSPISLPLVHRSSIFKPGDDNDQQQEATSSPPPLRRSLPPALGTHMLVHRYRAVDITIKVFRNRSGHLRLHGRPHGGVLRSGLHRHAAKRLLVHPGHGAGSTVSRASSATTSRSRSSTQRLLPPSPSSPATPPSATTSTSPSAAPKSAASATTTAPSSPTATTSPRASLSRPGEEGVSWQEESRPEKEVQKRLRRNREVREERERVKLYYQ